MGERKEDRVKMILPVRLTGKDSEGEPYSLLVHTLDFSRLGARLGGIRQPLRVGETVTLEYKRRRAHFAIRWVGKPGTRSEQQVGVESLEPGNFLWLDVPNQNYTDNVDPWSHRTNIEDPAPATAAAEMVVQEVVLTVDRINGQDSEPSVLGGEQAGRDSALDTSNQDRIISALERRIAVETLSLSAALELVAENARRLLNGTGAAIALPQNNEMVCRASAGRAPRIGVQFRVETGLTGEAVRSGRVVTCHDTLTDPRVDTEVWRKVGIQSAVSVPIPLSEGGTGVLEVFAAQSNAFTSAHGIVLEHLSALVHRLVATTTRI
jgi:putative methionine-R-sulfoxide reductase with GAF domain